MKFALVNRSQWLRWFPIWGLGCVFVELSGVSFFVDWHKILQMCQKVKLTSGEDKFWWTLNQNGKFTVSSFYRHT